MGERKDKMNFKDLILATLIGVFLFVWVLVGYTIWMKVEHNQARIGRLEVTARPLVIVDKYSEVYINGEKVDPQITQIDAD